MKHEMGAQASAPEPHITSHIPTPERKEERLTDERDAFEAWAERDNRRLEGLQYEERTPGNNNYYEDDTTNHAYIGWCAAVQSHRAAAGRDEIIEECASLAEAIADGEKEYSVTDTALRHTARRIRALKKDQP